MKSGPSHEHLAPHLEKVFYDHGYDQLNMTGLAKACGFTRRALYHHFSNKEDAFRYMLLWRGELNIAAGMAAGRTALEQGGSTIDIITEVMDARYGDTRRSLSLSPHALELNDQAFRRARDIMVEAATDFQTKLAELLTELDRRGLMRFKADTTVEGLAQVLCDGARGTNQSLPAIVPVELKSRYRTIIAAILFGTATPGKRSARP